MAKPNHTLLLEQFGSRHGGTREPNNALGDVFATGGQTAGGTYGGARVRQPIAVSGNGRPDPMPFVLGDADVSSSTAAAESSVKVQQNGTVAESPGPTLDLGILDPGTCNQECKETIMKNEAASLRSVKVEYLNDVLANQPPDVTPEDALQAQADYDKAVMLSNDAARCCSHEASMVEATNVQVAGDVDLTGEDTNTPEWPDMLGGQAQGGVAEGETNTLVADNFAMGPPLASPPVYACHGCGMSEYDLSEDQAGWSCSVCTKRREAGSPTDAQLGTEPPGTTCSFWDDAGPQPSVSTVSTTPSALFAPKVSVGEPSGTGPACEGFSAPSWSGSAASVAVGGWGLSARFPLQAVSTGKPARGAKRKRTFTHVGHPSIKGFYDGVASDAASYPSGEADIWDDGLAPRDRPTQSDEEFIDDGPGSVARSTSQGSLACLSDLANHPERPARDKRNKRLYQLG